MAQTAAAADTINWVPLRDIAKIIRSKNAGPFEITLDIIFNNAEDYEAVKAAGVLTKDRIAELYSISPDEVIAFVYFDIANALKATIARPRAQGSIGETDMHAAQHHVPLMNIPVPWSRKAIDQ